MLRIYVSIDEAGERRFMKELGKLVIRNLYKSFGDFKVLNDFNLTVERGEFVTFLGPSGCGKSTALNCICGLLQITSGEILVDDKVIDNGKDISVPAEKRGFGIVFQSYALFPHMTVAQNVSFGLRIKKMPKEEIARRVDEAINIVHLQGFENKYPGQLSGGQQQRVAIARSIVLEPILLMLDEPLSNLDAKLRMEMRYELKSLHERLRIASIYVTHDQSEALALSDKIVVLKRGLVMQIGSPKDVFERPMNLFVADFMGFKNFWKGKIVSMKEENGAVEVCLDINGKAFVSRRTYLESEALKVEKLRAAFQNGFPVETAIRPDDFMVGENSVNAFSAQIDLVSYSGHSNDISASVENGLRLDARVEGKIGSEKLGSEERTLSLCVPPEKVHVLVREDTDGND